MTLRNIIKAEVRWEAAEEEILYCRNTVSRDMPELLSDWVSAEPEEEEYTNVWPTQVNQNVSKNYSSIPHDKTDWYQLCCGIMRHWKDLKGLHDRRRIWADVEVIVNQIEEYRDEGKDLLT